MGASQRPAQDLVSGDSSAGERPGWLERLLEQPNSFDPFWVVGLLESLSGDAARVGGDGPFLEEAIRFRHSRSLTFKPGDIERITVDDEGRRSDDGQAELFELTCNVVGLTGTSSPLPTYLATEAARDDPAGDTKADFFDLFHHRLHSLLFRALRKYDWAREYDSEGSDAWTLRVLAMLGLDLYERPPLRYVRPLDLLRIAPLLATAARTAQTLESAIREILAHELLGADVEVKQFQGDWSKIDPDHKIRLAIENSNLGISAIIGDKCLHRAGKANIVVGPLTQAQLRAFLRGGTAFKALQELLDVLSYELVEFELELILGREARPTWELGRSRLADDAWLAMSDDREVLGDEKRIIVSLAEAIDMVREADGAEAGD